VRKVYGVHKRPLPVPNRVKHPKPSCGRNKKWLYLLALRSQKSIEIFNMCMGSCHGTYARFSWLSLTFPVLHVPRRGVSVDPILYLLLCYVYCLLLYYRYVNVSC